jgi:hypothetical protein
MRSPTKKIKIPLGPPPQSEDGAAAADIFAVSELHVRERRAGRPPLKTHALMLRSRAADPALAVPLLLGSRPFRAAGVAAAAARINAALADAARAAETLAD